jgi:hypothetical protein
MTGIEKALELAMRQRGRELNANVERTGHASQCWHGHALKMAAFDQGDNSVGYSGLSSDVALAPTVTKPHHPKRRAKALVIHVPNDGATRLLMPYLGMRSHRRCAARTSGSSETQLRAPRQV